MRFGFAILFFCRKSGKGDFSYAWVADCGIVGDVQVGEDGFHCANFVETRFKPPAPFLSYLCAAVCCKSYTFRRLYSIVMSVQRVFINIMCVCIVIIISDID